MSRLMATVRQQAGLIGVIVLAAVVVALVLQDSRKTVVRIDNHAGYPVAPEFQPFYERHGGAEILGYALTEPFFIPDEDSRLLQYFENVRLEYNIFDQQVEVSDLGRWAAPLPEKQVLAPEDGPDSGRLFEETGFAVRGEFLNFYDSMVGPTLLGLPLTAELNEADTRVQYFENGLLEWHPEMPLDRRVQLGPLGQAHFRRQGFNIYPEVRNASISNAVAVRSVSIEAVFWAPILFAGDEQTVFVSVTRSDDQQPVEGIRLKATITVDGQTHNTVLPVSDKLGDSKAALKLDGVEPGQKVLVTITAERPDGLVVGNGTFSFRTWW